MIPEPTNEAAATALEEIKVLYGPPPVLKTESPEAYYKIMSRYLEVLKPREFIEMTFIPHLTNATWEIIRYSRYKSSMMESGFQKELQAQGGVRDAWGRDPLAGPIAAMRLARIKFGSGEAIEKENKNENPAENAALKEVKTNERSANDIDYVRILQKDFEYHEQLDIWLSRAHVRLNAALEQFEQYRDGLGERLLRVSSEIIEAVALPKQIASSNIPLAEQQP